MGYMGLPLAQSVVGPMGVFYCSAGVVAYNILVFTYGSWMFLRHKEGYKFSPKSLILNPGIIAVSIGIPLFIFGIKMPSFLDSATQHIANMNTPLAMLLLGTYISNADIKTLFKQKENYLVLLLKQICMPLIMITIYRLLGFEGDLLTSIGISCCVPCATNTVMFAVAMMRTPEPQRSRCVLHLYGYLYDAVYDCIHEIMTSKELFEILPHGVCRFSDFENHLIDCRNKNLIPENAKSIIVYLFRTI